MSAPEKIYRHATRSKNLFHEAIYADHPWPEDNPVEYIRADLHDAELNELRAENARLTAPLTPPTIMTAEEVTEPGLYGWRRSAAGNWDTVKVVARLATKADYDRIYDEYESTLEAPDD
jgi:hypothetical protein